MRALVTAGAALILANCATSAQREASRMQGMVNESVAQVQACWRDTEASPLYQPLKGKLPPSEGAPLMALLTNQAKPTPEESAALLALHDGPIMTCRRRAIEGAAQVHPSYSVVFAQAYAQADIDYAALVRREMSWGDFAQRSQRRRQETTAALAEVDGKVRQQLATSHAYEMQQRAAFAQAMQQWSYQQQVLAQQRQIIDAAYRPVYTTCSYVGSILNCASQ